MKKYRILSPDGFDIERDRTYKKNELEQAISLFVKRFEPQGYYSNSNRERIPLNEIECEIIKVTK